MDVVSALLQNISMQIKGRADSLPPYLRWNVGSAVTAGSDRLRNLDQAVMRGGLLIFLMPAAVILLQVGPPPDSDSSPELRPDLNSWRDGSACGGTCRPFSCRGPLPHRSCCGWEGLTLKRLDLTVVCWVTEAKDVAPPSSGVQAQER